MLSCGRSAVSLHARSVSLKPRLQRTGPASRMRRLRCTRNSETMGRAMSKEFDAQIDAILGACKAATDQAAQQALDARTAAAAFSK